MTYRVILNQDSTVIASAEIDQQFHFITKSTYEVFNIPMTQRLSLTQIAFIPNFEPPKKPLNPKVRHLNNTLHLGEITAARFINQVLYIATSKGNIIEVDPRTQFILDVTKMTDESIRDFLISDHGNLTVCTANSVLVLTDQKDIIDVPVTEPLRLYPSNKVPITEKTSNIPFSQICLVQTATQIGQLDVVNAQLTLKGLFENTFYDAVDLPQLGLIVAINAHKRLSVYNYNGKCYGKCEMAFKPRKMLFLESGAILIYTYCDRLVQVFMKVVDNGKKCTFIANGLSTPRIQSAISTSCPKEVHEGLEQVFEQQRPVANMYLGNSYVCVGRAHSAAVVDFAAYFVNINENEGLKNLVPKNYQQENAYQYYMKQFKNADIQVQNEQLQLAVKIAKDKIQPHTEIINQCKVKFQQTLKLYEESYPDVIPEGALNVDDYQQIVDEALTYMQEVEDNACQYIIKEFPKEIQRPEDVKIDVFNLSAEILAQYVQKYDENDYISERKVFLDKIYTQLQENTKNFVENTSKYVPYVDPNAAVEEVVANVAPQKPSKVQPIAPVVVKPSQSIKEKVDQNIQEQVDQYSATCWEIVQQTRLYNLKERLISINSGLRMMDPKLEQFDYHLNKVVSTLFKYEQNAVTQRQQSEKIKDQKQSDVKVELVKQSNEEESSDSESSQKGSKLIDPQSTVSQSENISAILDAPKFTKIDPLKMAKPTKKVETPVEEDIEDVVNEEDSFENAIELVQAQKLEPVEHKKRVSRKTQRQLKENEGKFLDIFNPESQADPVISEEQFLHAIRAAMLARQAVYSTTVRNKHLQVFDSAIEDANQLIHLYLPECSVIDSRFVLLPTEKIGKSAWESLLLAYDLRLHHFCSAKQLPSNLSGRQFIRNFRAINHQGLLSYLGYGFSTFNSFYIFTQAAPEFTLLDVLQNKYRPFKNENDIKQFIKKLLEAIDFLNSGEIKLLHRDLRPSQVWIDVSGPAPQPKIYHIGFMQTVLAKEQSELDTFFAAPEVMCGGVTPSSDVWSIGTLTFKLLEQLVGAKVPLFAPGYFSDENLKDLPQGYTAQQANNAFVLAQMIEQAKDVQEIVKGRVIVVKENFKDTFLKESKIVGENVKSYAPAFGILPWDSENKGVAREPKNNVLAKLYKKVDSDALDFIQKCWCIQPGKRETGKAKLGHKWFTTQAEEKAE